MTADEFGGVAIASEKRVSARRHPGEISGRPGLAKPDGAQLDGAGLAVNEFRAAASGSSLRLLPVVFQ
jgi:hypothetical protein